MKIEIKVALRNTILLISTFFVFNLENGFADEVPIVSPAALALSLLENAYRKKDIEAAILLKDFQSEAKLIGDDLIATDKELITSTAEKLELSFRKDIKENGFPNFENISCTVVKEDIFGEYIHLTEKCTNPDGGTSSQILIVSKIDDKLRIVGLLA